MILDRATYLKGACETGGQFHIICKKVPEALIEHRLHMGSVVTIIE